MWVTTGVTIRLFVLTSTSTQKKLQSQQGPRVNKKIEKKNRRSIKMKQRLRQLVPAAALLGLVAPRTGVYAQRTIDHPYSVVA